MPGQTLCYSRNLTLPACTVYCRNPNLYTLANTARQAEHDVILVGEYYRQVFTPVADCQFIDQYGAYIDRPLCKDMM